MKNQINKLNTFTIKQRIAGVRQTVSEGLDEVETSLRADIVNVRSDIAALDAGTTYVTPTSVQSFLLNSADFFGIGGEGLWTPYSSNTWLPTVNVEGRGALYYASFHSPWAANTFPGGNVADMRIVVDDEILIADNTSFINTSAAEAREYVFWGTVSGGRRISNSPIYFKSSLKVEVRYNQVSPPAAEPWINYQLY